MNDISDTTTIVVAIISAAIGITGMLGIMLRFLTKRIDDLRTDTAKRLDEQKTDTTRQFAEAKADRATQLNELRTEMRNGFAEVSTRLQRVETRIDDTNKRIDLMGRDIADLRDRTGALEGALSTFMNERRDTSAA